MFNLGLFELTLFGIIALIVLGPDKLPTAAKTLGRWYGKIRRASNQLHSEITRELNLLETQEQLKAELTKIRENEALMRSQMQALQRSVEQTQHQIQNITPITQHTAKPMHYHWFLLGEYDRRRRLPPPPFLPNYAADPLLYQQRMSQ